VNLVSPISQTDERQVAKPYEVDGVWRVDATCKGCQAEVRLESESRPPAYALKLVPAILCEDCDARAEAARDRSEFRRGLSDRVRKAGLPRELQDLAWADMDRDGQRRPAIIAARAWAEAKHGRMLLVGPVGTGKTRLAATAAWQVLQHGSLTWVSVPLLFVHAFMPATSPERRHAVEVMGGTGPLILDDLGKEKPGDWARQILFGAIDSRIQAGSPVLITSNFDADEIADRLGVAVGDRLAAFHQYELAGRSRREPPRKDLE
jgi:DNA replication protein DnaC